MSTAEILHFDQRRIQGPWFHITTIDSRSNLLVGLHRHDYAEIFWLDAGRCCHVVNGREEELRAGDLVLLRPEDEHRMWEDGRSFRFTNLSLAPQLYADLKQRHPEHWQLLYGGEEALHLHLAPADLDTVMSQARSLASVPHSRLAVEHLVIGLWLRCLQQRPQGSGSDLPDWLQEALMRIEEPEIFCQGVPGLVAVAGRSAEHLSRECKKRLGQTPSQIVNQARMRYAAYQLRMSTRSVESIAQDCGFDDPGRFYRLFKKHYGNSPGRYRRE